MLLNMETKSPREEGRGLQASTCSSITTSLRFESSPVICTSILGTHLTESRVLISVLVRCRNDIFRLSDKVQVISEVGRSDRSKSLEQKCR